MKELRILKSIRTKLLNRQIETQEEFEEVQDKLNLVEAQIKELEVK